MKTTMIFAGLLVVALVVAAFACRPLLRQCQSLAAVQGDWIEANQKRLFCALVALIALMAVSLYATSGSWRAQMRYLVVQGEQVEADKQLSQIHSAQQLITRLRAAVIANPEHAKGWYLLGKLYSSQRQYKQAYDALMRASQFQPNSLDITAALYDAAFFEQGGRLTSKQSQQLLGFVHRHPQAYAAMNVLAVDNYAKQHYDQAIALWEILLQHVGEHSRSAERLLAMIASAQTQQARIAAVN